MYQSLDLQRDHVSLVREAARLLTPGGVLLFSSHARRFELDTDGLAGWRVEEISRETVDLDFARRHSHRCWRIERL
jgi:23S rRNA (guanine2445-N2)-methyltransferase / 23S rRNA (guanine2069-N7)-methyltransferase